MRKALKPLLVVLLLFMISIIQESPLSALETPRKSYPANGLIVKLKEGGKVQSLGLVSTKSSRNFHLVSVDKSKEQEEIRWLSTNPAVEYVEPNYIRELIRPFGGGPTDTVTVTVPYTPTFEFLKLINADLAHNKGYIGDPGVVIAIADTGVYTSHPLLKDVLLEGFNFLDFSANVADSEFGHGTHVAGIAHNVCPNCRILPIKVVDGFSGDDFSISLGIRAAGDYGARVLNISLGGDAPSRIICEAVAYAQQKGTIVVTSAGNWASAVVGYPASCNPEVVVVAAVDDYDNPALFSNFGPKVDIAAPGVWILSSVPPDPPEFPYPDYVMMSGTSMSSPMVAGAIALVAAHSAPLNWTNEQIIKRVFETAEDFSTLPGIDDMFGKRLDVAKAVGIAYRPVAVGFESKTSLLPAAGGEVSFSAVVRNQNSAVLLVSRGITTEATLYNLTDLVTLNPCFGRHCANYTVPRNQGNDREVYAFSIYVQNKQGKRQTETQKIIVQSPTEVQIVPTIPKVLISRLYLPFVKSE